MNVLLVFADQMHKFALGCMGTAGIKTPHLDALAAGGVLFTNAYSNCPICTPFRINLFTGMYSSQTGTLTNESRIPDGIDTLANQFNAGGFQTCFVGKWHIGASGNQPVPEDLRGGFSGFTGYQCYNGFYKDVIFHDESGEPRAFEGRHRTDVTTDVAIERLERLAADPGKPFFLCVAYQAPHYPVQPAPEYEAMYEGVTIPRRGNVVDGVDPYTPTASPRSPRPVETCPDYQRYGNDLDTYVRLYNALVTQVDANVGRLLAALDRLGLAGDTAVIFTADHGDMQGSHGLKNKSLPYEESAGIPLVMRVPGGAAGATVAAPVSGIDLHPTCLDLAGLPPVEGLPGRSIIPLARGEPGLDDRPVFSECKDWRMVRKGPFKLVASVPGNVPGELFNLDEDPLELRDLVSDEAYAGVVMELQQAIQREFEGLDVTSWQGALLKRAPDGAGVLLARVPVTSIAAMLAIEAGDVVVAVNGVPVHDVHGFISMVDESAGDPGDAVLAVDRNGARVEIVL